jgi:hypothetical protein
MTTNNPVVQPDGVVEARERIFVSTTCGGYSETRESVHDIEYVRAPTPDSIAEKARRVVDVFNEWLVTDFEPTLTADKSDALQRIVTTEFGAGGEGAGGEGAKTG